MKFKYSNPPPNAPSLSFSIAVNSDQTWIFVLASGIVSIIFCAIGGLKAVVWVDVTQAFIMVIVQTIILIKSCIDAGGPNAVIDYNTINQTKLDFPDFSIDFYKANNFWNMVIYSLTIWATFSINQIAMQRTLACKSKKQGQTALYMTWPINFYVIGVSCLIGLSLACFYDGADLKRSSDNPDGPLESYDQLLTYYVKSWSDNGKWPGFIGLYSAALYSGAISSVSSSQAALSQLTLDDFIRPFFRIKNEKYALLISRCLMVFYGTIAILLAYVASLLGDLLRPTLSIAATFVGPFMGLFIAAAIPISTVHGSMIGGALSFILTIWICVGQINYTADYDGDGNLVLNGLDYLYGLSYLLLAPIGMILSLTFSLIFSIFDRLSAKNSTEKFFKPDSNLVLHYKKFDKFNSKFMRNNSTTDDLNYILNEKSMTISVSSFRNYDVDQAFENLAEELSRHGSMTELPRMRVQSSATSF